jgi:23S rRNA (cytidine1920-2'-O)/16S rRNA (cytidine1409-2'-O)-methyltransferase
VPRLAYDHEDGSLTARTSTSEGSASSRAKMRLDLLMVQKGLAPSREQARRLILEGKVKVDSLTILKPGTLVSPEAHIEVATQPRYVSRGGYKLEHALASFGIRVEAKIAADVGASTGGFTDCLLQHGAAKVYAIDVGYGQLSWKLRNDPRVVVLERTNVRYLSALPEPVDLITIDVSFISLKLVLPVVAAWLRADGDIIALVKPQFEAGPSQVGKGGVVRDPTVHKEVLRRVAASAAANNLFVHGITPSPILGPAGNREYFMWLRKEPAIGLDVEGLLQRAVEAGGVER